MPPSSPTTGTTCTRRTWPTSGGSASASRSISACDTTSSGPDFLSTTSAANARINPDLKLSHVQEVTVSLERELAPNLAVRGLYVLKRNGDAFSTVNILRPYSAFNIPITRRDPGPDGLLSTTDDGDLVTIYD